MFDLGTQELIVIFIVAFLVFGPKKLPELGRTLGKGIRELKAAMQGVKESMDAAEDNVTGEFKDVKSSLEDSVYKSLETHLSDSGDSKESAGSSDDSKPAGTEGTDKAPKEASDKDE